MSKDKRIIDEIWKYSGTKSIIFPYYFKYKFGTYTISIRIGHDANYRGLFILSNSMLLNGYNSKALKIISKLKYSYYISLSLLDAEFKLNRITVDIPITKLKFV